MPVVWAVAKGSLKNKAILVPAALAISAFIPWAIAPLLMAVGAYLCYEGFEKIADKLMPDGTEDAHRAKHLNALADPAVDLVAIEQDKIHGAIRTDFILSAEIVVIALGTAADVAFGMQVAVLCAIAILMTVGVYGIAATVPGIGAILESVLPTLILAGALVLVGVTVGARFLRMIKVAR